MNARQQSSGKTTLCNALARRLDLEKGQSYITEVARGVMKDKGYTRDDIHLFQMQEDILLAQIAREEDTRDLYPVQVMDRSAIDSLVYARLTGADEEDSETRMDCLLAPQAMQLTLVQYRKASSLFVLLTPVEGWLVDDGVRSLDDQTRTVEIFRQVLKMLNIAYVEIGQEEKDLERRVKVVLNALYK